MLRVYLGIFFFFNNFFKQRTMARIMAVDYGTVRTGIATTDILQIIAAPLETVPTGKLLDFFKDYLKFEAVETIVVGQPFHRDGTPTKLEKDIGKFLEQFTKLFPAIKIVRQDERLTSKMAEDVIRKTVTKKKDRQDKGLVDRISAAIILQEYMGIY